MLMWLSALLLLTIATPASSASTATTATTAAAVLAIIAATIIVAARCVAERFGTVFDINHLRFFLVVSIFGIFDFDALDWL